MPTYDPSLTLFFLFFLAVFVMLGLVPFLQKVSARLQSLLQQTPESGTGGGEGTAGSSAMKGGEGYEDEFGPQIYDLEVLALRSLARGGMKGNKLKAVAKQMHLAPATASAVLESLRSKGMAGSVSSFPFGRRYFLSRRGRERAVALGFMLKRSRTRLVAVD